MAYTKEQLDGMTEDELVAYSQELDAQRQAIRDEMIAVQEAISRAQARAKVESMSDAEKDALRQVLTNAGGIDASKE